MKLTVVVPVRNEEAVIGRCIEGLRAQIRDGVEVIVADDGSTDATARVVQDGFPDARVLRLPPRGSASARVSAIAQARAPRIAFLDADCVPDPGWVDAALRGEGVVMGRVRAEGTLRARLLHLLDFGEFLDVRPRTLRNFALLNLAGPTELFRRVPLPEVPHSHDRLWSWTLVRAGTEIRYDPAQSVLHAPALSARSMLRRRVSYAQRFIAARRVDPTLPGGRLLRFGPLAAPLLAGGRLWRDLGRLVRVRGAMGIGISMPLYAAALAAVRTLDAFVFTWESLRSR
jgi:glycosyltransferase involved in cell wall biosynthesis